MYFGIFIPLYIVIKFVEAGHRYQSAPGGSQWVEDLQTSFAPDLKRYKAYITKSALQLGLSAISSMELIFFAFIFLLYHHFITSQLVQDAIDEKTSIELMIINFKCVTTISKGYGWIRYILGSENKVNKNNSQGHFAEYVSCHSFYLCNNK